MKERLQPYTGWLPKWLKDLLCLVGCGDALIEYCNNCGARQPISWWCRDSALWLEVNGTQAGALCPKCFDRRAAEIGKFIRWYPEAILFDAAAERSGETR